MVTCHPFFAKNMKKYNGYSYREQKRLEKSKEKESKYQESRRVKLEKQALEIQKKLKTEREDYLRKEKIARDTARRRENHAAKIKLLEESGIELWGLKYRDIEKVTMREVRSGKLNPDTPYKFARYALPWDKVYSLLPDCLYVAYQDYAQETSLMDILKIERVKTDSQLLFDLYTIVGMPVTYRKGKTGSSGKAGSAIFACGSSGRYGELWDMYVKVRSQNNHINALYRKKIRVKSGRYKGWQTIKWGGKSTTDKVTPRQVIEIINALLWNVVEIERWELYESFVRMCRKHLPDILSYLPDIGGW